jgi:hypothetical protein
VHNPVSDAFSRLCPVETQQGEEFANAVLEEDTQYVPKKEWLLISKVYNTLVGHHVVERTIAKLREQGLEANADPYQTF